MLFSNSGFAIRRAIRVCIWEVLNSTWLRCGLEGDKSQIRGPGLEGLSLS